MPVPSGQVCLQPQVSGSTSPGWASAPESYAEQLQPLEQTSGAYGEEGGCQGQKGPVAKTSLPTEMGLGSFGKFFHRVLDLGNLYRV
jgi:hypothetical protein